MSARWDSEALLQPITAERPCGENLEDTQLLTSLDALRLFGQPRSLDVPPEPGEIRKPPEWGEIRTTALEGLGKSKDLRLLACLGAALLRTDGLTPFLDTLTVASGWLESYWDQVYPPIDEDAIARRNALNRFADPMAVVDRLRRIPLVESRQHGRFSLRDVEIATGQIQPSAGDARPEEARVTAAFAETPVEQLSAVQQTVARALEAVTRIDAKMREEAGPEVAPSFDPLSAQLVKLNRLLRTELASRNGHEAVATEPATTGSAGAAREVAVPVGAIGSRQDAVRAIEAAAEFFRRNEPSSPVPLLLDRAKRLVAAKDFLEVLADLAPDGLSSARAAAGLRDGE